MASKSSDDPSQPVKPAGDAVHGGGPPGHSEAQARTSPLTYQKVFSEIPRVTGVNTPNINDKIAKPWNLTPVTNSTKFKKAYVDGRSVLRYST